MSFESPHNIICIEEWTLPPPCSSNPPTFLTLSPLQLEAEEILRAKLCFGRLGILLLQGVG